MSVRYKDHTEWSKGGYTACADTHPALEIPGTGLHIYGGSCIHPVVKDADVYVGFQTGMKSTIRQLPWYDGTEFLFPISDMQAPKSLPEFMNLLNFLASNMEDGKKVHIGCIGGHGRTGLVLAALVTHMTGEYDSITYVRKHYCKKAVESSTQIDFLHDNFCIKKVAGSKSGKRLNTYHSKYKGISKTIDDYVSGGTMTVHSNDSHVKQYPHVSGKTIWSK